MEDVIRVDDDWYVLASSSRTDDRTRVLKQDETFCLFDRYGDIQHIGAGEQGLYHEGTRFLSCYELTINNLRPLLLNSTVKQDNSAMTVDLTTPDIFSGNKISIHSGTLHIFRAKYLLGGAQYEHLRMINYGQHVLTTTIEIKFAADYYDIFQVRGIKREKTGTRLPQKDFKCSVRLGYKGLDDIERYTVITFSEEIKLIAPDTIQLQCKLEPHEEGNCYISISCQTGNEVNKPLPYETVVQQTNESIRLLSSKRASLFSSNEQFNDWINRSAADLNMLTTDTPHGPYPYAGVPWFSTAFGRDGIITALQYLWLYPDVARGVLAFLSATQATTLDPAIDSEPGKILHETRAGEMAELGEIPFKAYYGTIDATPLYIVLAGKYYKRTGDRPFIESIWHNLERALEWIDKYGDRDGDGFVEYYRESDNGLVQQGWKDSNDSIFHHDGKPAEGPIALVEVQGYVYHAKKTMADFYKLFGETLRYQQLIADAARLKTKFNDVFWSDRISTYVIALDGNKKQCEVTSSNAGHTLYSGIASREYARRVADTLTSDDSFSGWGIRTLAKSERRYNPMSYHNGSIWPHDNSLIVMGLAKYGFYDKALKILTGMFDTSINMDLNRLPELFCGFDRLPAQGPTLYPVACAPQAWASGALFGMIQACLGLTFSAEKPQIRFHYPQLPDYLQRLQISNLRFGNAVIDLSLRRHLNDVGINVIRKEGDIGIVVTL
ncbi:Glycogen debranching enzyme [hydrothermal vent metagenome]|uniref:Glycogen debranching enzyme n=1 Tax=hydrothermal vent metagenome TaxID=652676 RepID=A0A3B0ZZA3_9ZZZZ